MARSPRPLSHALHADLVILDEFGRALLPRTSPSSLPRRALPRPENWPTPSSRSWPRATTILGATFGKPRAKTSCARSTLPDRHLPRSRQPASKCCFRDGTLEPSVRYSTRRCLHYLYFVNRR